LLANVSLEGLGLAPEARGEVWRPHPGTIPDRLEDGERPGAVLARSVEPGQAVFDLSYLVLVEITSIAKRDARVGPREVERHSVDQPVAPAEPSEQFV
jgi:hypothetical protein